MRREMWVEEVKTGPSANNGYFRAMLSRVGNSKVLSFAVIFCRVRSLVWLTTHYRLLPLRQTSQTKAREKGLFCRSFVLHAWNCKTGTKTAEIIVPVENIYANKFTVNMCREDACTRVTFASRRKWLAAYSNSPLNHTTWLHKYSCARLVLHQGCIASPWRVNNTFKCPSITHVL